MNRIYDSILTQASREADIIEEVNEDLTYIGFYLCGDPTKCLIRKIEKMGLVTTFKYPGGLLEYNQDWADRATLTYTFKR